MSNSAAQMTMHVPWNTAYADYLQTEVCGTSALHVCDLR